MCVVKRGLDALRQQWALPVPVAHRLPPGLCPAAEPARVQHEQLHAYVGGDVNFLVELRLGDLVVARIAGVIDLDAMLFPRRLWQDHAAPLVGVQRLDAGVQVAVQEAEVHFRGGGTFARSQYPQWGRAGEPHLRVQAGVAGGPARGFVVVEQLDAPVARIREVAQHRFARHVVAQDEEGRAPAGAAIQCLEPIQAIGHAGPIERPFGAGRAVREPAEAKRRVRKIDQLDTVPRASYGVPDLPGPRADLRQRGRLVACVGDGEPAGQEGRVVEPRMDLDGDRA